MPHKRLTRFIRKRLDPRPFRPFQLRRKSVVRFGELKPADDPFVLHRSGFVVETDQEMQERRAMPASVVEGSLPERIVYRALVQRELMQDLQFDFQSSQQGGRLHLGGMVVDFLFLDRPLALRIQSKFFHSGVEQAVVDDEQKSVLERMGYVVFDLWDSTILDPMLLEEWMRRYIDQPLLIGGGEVISAATAMGLTLPVMPLLNEHDDRLKRVEEDLSRVLKALFEGSSDTSLSISDAAVLTLRANKLRTGSILADQDVQSTGFVAGQQGWRIRGTGAAEFENVIVRGELNTSVFVTNAQSAVSGTQIVSEATVLIADVAAADTTIDVKEQLWSTDDIVRFKTSLTNDEYMKVTDDGTAITGGFRYTVTRNLDGSGANAFYSGEVGVRLGASRSSNRSLMWGEVDSSLGAPQWGASGNGWIGSGTSDYGGYLVLDGTSTDGPFLGVTVRTGEAHNALSDRIRVGRMRNFLDYGQRDAYGIGVGEIGKFMSYDRSLGLRVRTASGDTTMDDSGLTTEDFRLTPVSSSPAYQDGYLLLYYLNSGGTRTLRARIKDGATESEQTIATF